MKSPLCRSIFTISLCTTLLATSFAGPVERLKERESKVKALVQNAMPAVVAIVGVDQPATGSGVVISEDGLIMTAGHVTDAAGHDLMIIFPDGRRVKGRSLGANRSRDAGLAMIVEEGKWPHVEIGDSGEVELGDWVVAMGHPGGYDLNRPPPVRLGRIVSKGQMGMFRSDCTLVGGDSGGPMFNLDGEVIGIHSSIGGNLAENRHVPTAVFQSDWERMVAGEVWGDLRMLASGLSPEQPVMGVRMRQDARGGVVVDGVMPNSPAQRAGVRAGDLILQVDGEEPASISDVVGYVFSKKAGVEIELRVLREGGEKSFFVKLVRWADLVGGGRPAAPLPAAGRVHFGVVLDDKAESAGATVHQVEPGSPAADAGLEAGDVVLEINGMEVGDALGMADIVGGYRPGEDIDVLFLRGGDKKTIRLKLGSR